MTVLYRIYKFVVPFICRTYFGKILLKGEEKVTGNEPVIFVANHPSALMDPMICGAFSKVPINYLGRADLFKSKLSTWFLTNSHMWPIYRDVDGRDNLDKNEEVFNRCYAKLKTNQALLLFGEGFTDEKFVRRVKGIKKGPARIAFGAEEKYNFEMGLKIIPLGINYTNPDQFGSDLLIQYGEPINVADYKDLFVKNPAKAMLELTKTIEEELKNVILHIDDKNKLDVYERSLRLDEGSFAIASTLVKKDLFTAWKKAKQKALAINSAGEEKLKDLEISLKETINNEVLIEAFKTKLKNSGNIVRFICLLPFALIGLTLNFPIFFLLKTIPQKLTKRSCFYPGMKVAFSMIFFPILLGLEFIAISCFMEIPWYYFIVFIIAGTFLGYISLKTLLIFRKIKLNVKSNKYYSALSNEIKTRNKLNLSRIQSLFN